MLALTPTGQTARTTVLGRSEFLYRCPRLPCGLIDASKPCGSSACPQENCYVHPSILFPRTHRRRMRRALPDESRPIRLDETDGVKTDKSVDVQQVEEGSHANGRTGESTQIAVGSSHTPEQEQVEPQPTGMPQRWKIVFMMALAFILCNMDKVNMSVAVIPMAKDLGWTATDRGLVSSAFFWGYTLTQLPAGWLSTKFGGTTVLMAGVALWSFGTLIAPPAAQFGLVWLCVSRVLVGLGEGFAPSAATNVIAKLVPYTERARAVSTVWGGLDVGSAVGLLLSGPLIRIYGWPSVFYLFAILGGIWCIFWPMLKPDSSDKSLPKEQRREMRELMGQLKEEERNGAAPPSQKLPWGKFMTSIPVWAIIVAHFSFNWGYYTLLAWLPSYFEMALGLNVQSSSFLTLIPYVAMVLMTPFVGPVADGMVKRGMSLTSVRKICQGAAFIGPALCMIACGWLSPTTAAAISGTSTILLVALLSLGFALGAWSRAGLYCNHQDLSPKYSSVLLGITNTFGAVPGVLGVTSAGYLLDMTNNWAWSLFYPTAICQILGAIVYVLCASSERQEWS